MCKEMCKGQAALEECCSTHLEAVGEVSHPASLPIGMGDDDHLACQGM